MRRLTLIQLTKQSIKYGNEKAKAFNITFSPGHGGSRAGGMMAGNMGGGMMVGQSGGMMVGQPVGFNAGQPGMAVQLSGNRAGQLQYGIPI